MLLFALDASRTLGDRIANSLNIDLADHEEREFEDGEFKIRPLVNVRGREIYVIHSLFGDGRQSVNDKLCRLLFFIGALKDAHARKVTAVVPYFAFARKDRRTKPRDPVSMRYSAQLFEAVGTDHVLTMDIHNPAAFDNAFRIPTDHLEAQVLFVPWLARHFGKAPLVVVSPDAGGVKRAERLRESLSFLLERDIDKAFVEKRRSGGVVSGEMLAGVVTGKTAIIVDDIISSGVTLGRAANVLRAHGAARTVAVCSHGLFGAGAGENLAGCGLERVIVTDTAQPVEPSFARDGSLEMVTLSTGELFAEAITRIDDGDSVTALLHAPHHGFSRE